MPEVTRGSKGLQVIIGGYKGSLGVETVYRGLKEVKRGFRGLQ